MLPAAPSLIDRFIDLLVEAVAREVAETIRTPETPMPEQHNDSPEPSFAGRNRGTGNDLASALSTGAERAA